jgi:hypothetical protein
MIKLVQNIHIELLDVHTAVKPISVIDTLTDMARKSWHSEVKINEFIDKERVCE